MSKIPATAPTWVSKFLASAVSRDSTRTGVPEGIMAQVWRLPGRAFASDGHRLHIENGPHPVDSFEAVSALWLATEGKDKPYGSPTADNAATADNAVTQILRTGEKGTSRTVRYEAKALRKVLHGAIAASRVKVKGLRQARRAAREDRTQTPSQRRSSDADLKAMADAAAYAWVQLPDGALVNARYLLDALDGADTAEVTYVLDDGTRGSNEYRNAMYEPIRVVLPQGRLAVIMPARSGGHAVIYATLPEGEVTPPCAAAPRKSLAIPREGYGSAPTVPGPRKRAPRKPRSAKAEAAEVAAIRASGDPAVDTLDHLPCAGSQIRKVGDDAYQVTGPSGEDLGTHDTSFAAARTALRAAGQWSDPDPAPTPDPVISADDARALNAACDDLAAAARQILAARRGAAPRVRYYWGSDGRRTSAPLPPTSVAA